jgi:hypothetical protein
MLNLFLESFHIPENVCFPNFFAKTLKKIFIFENISVGQKSQFLRNYTFSKQSWSSDLCLVQVTYQAVLSRLICFGCPFPAFSGIMSQLFCHDRLATIVSSGLPVPANLFLLSCYHVLVVLSSLSCLALLSLLYSGFLYWLSCPSCPTPAALPQTHVPGPPVAALLSLLAFLFRPVLSFHFQVNLSNLTCFSCSVPDVQSPVVPVMSVLP